MRVRIAWALAVLATLGVRPLAADEGDDRYRFAKGLYARRQWDLAAAEFAELLQRHPGHDECERARFYLGEALVQQNAFQEAAEHFGHYLENQPSGEFRRQALFRWAECAYLGGESAEARRRLELFSEAFPDDPLNGLVLNYRARLALARSEPAEAELLFRQSLARFPEGAFQDDCRLGLALALEAAGNLDEAERYYLALAAKRASAVACEARYRLGALEYSQGRYVSAIENFSAMEQHEAAEPWGSSSLLGKGWALVKLDRHSEAAEVFRSLQEHATVGIQATYWLGLCYKAQADWIRAAEVFLATARRLEDTEATGPPAEHSHRAPPAGNDCGVNLAAVLFHAGDSELAAGNLDEALRLFERAESVASADEPWADDIRRAAIQTLLRLKQYPRLERQAARFLEELPGSELVIHVLRLLARAQLEQNAYADAEATLSRMDELAGGEGAVAEDALLLGMAYEGQGRFAAAIGPLETFLAGGDHASRPQALALLAVCCARTGRFEDAFRLYRETFPDTAAADRLSADAAERIADAALEAEHFEQAESFYRRVLSLKLCEIQRGRALVGLAWCRFRLADLAGAEGALAEALNLPLDDMLQAEARFLRARTLQQENDVEAAWEVYDRVVHDGRGSPYWREALWWKARLSEQLGRWTTARETYETLLAVVPDHRQTAAALYHLAWILRRHDDLPRSADLFRRLFQEYRESPYWGHAALSVAQQHLEAGETVEAEATVVDLLASGHHAGILDRALYLAGQISFAGGDWRQARHRFERLLDECPESDLATAAGIAAADAMYRDGDGDALERLAQPAARGGSNMESSVHAVARLRLAQLHAEAERWTDAYQQVATFSADFPAFAEQHEVDYVLGRCLAARALFAEARHAYQQVIDSPRGELTETAAKAQLMIAESYFHQRAYMEALRAYMLVDIVYDYPALRAAALLQAGKCRRLLGDANEAEKLYHQVLEDFPDTHAAEQAARQLQSRR